MRALARFLGRSVLALGWAAFLLVAVLFLAEKTGLLTRFARRFLVARTGLPEDAIDVGHIHLRLFRSTVVVEGLKLGPEGEMVRLDRASVGLDLFAHGGPRVRRIDSEGGHVRLSPALFERIGKIAEQFPARAPGAPRTAAIPSITVRGLHVDVDTLRFGRLPIGSVDVAVHEVEGGTPVLTGRLLPSLSSSPGGSGEIVLNGQESKPGTFDVNASAAGVPISTDYLPEGTEVEGLRAYAPHGSLAVSAWGEISFDGRTPPHGEARISLTDGSFAAGRGQSVERIQVDLEAKYVPPSLDELWNTNDLSLGARIHSAWRGSAIEAVVRAGANAPPSSLFTVDLHAPDLEVRHELLDLSGGGANEENVWAALEPRGKAELWAGVTCARNWLPGEEIAPKLGFACEVGMHGGAGITYHGFSSAATGRRDQGFPLPLDGLEGGVVCASDLRQHRRLKIGIVDVAGVPAQGRVTGRGLVTSPPADAPKGAPGQGYVEVDLDLHGEHLPVDGALRAALAGLSDPVPPATTWEPFAPDGGTLSPRVRVMRAVDMPYAATEVAIDLEDVGIRWADVPVPVSRTRGTFEFRSDGRSEGGAAGRFHGNARTAAGLDVAFRFQTDPSVPAPPKGKGRIDEIAMVSVSATRASLTGDDKAIVLAQFPGPRAALEAAAPKGFADVSYSRIRTGPKLEATTLLEIAPREAELTPVDFRIPIGSVRGRVLAHSVDGGATPELPAETILAPLVGVFGKEMVVAATAEFPPGRIRVRGAGVDPSNPGLLGALGQSSGGGGGYLSALTVEGLLDVDGEIRTGADAAQSSQAFRVFLRENSLQTSKSFRLDRLRGVLDLRGDRKLYGRGLQASLADTTIDLEDLRFAPTPGEGFELTTRLSKVENLPLDHDHLRGFVDESTLQALLGPLGWKGTLNIESGNLKITGSSQEDTRLDFSGQILATNMEVQLGLPLSVSSASATIDELIFERGRVRAMCRIQDLYGTVAGRKLDKAAMLLTYVEPRLAIEAIDGEFERGKVLPLGEGAEHQEKADRPGTAFSIDLEEPFPFQLALYLQGVELPGLFKGLFAASFATRGKLDCQLRLTGDTRRVLGIKGTGSVQVRDSSLWAVPVFRALFSQLGIDDTLVFQNLAANLRIQNGVIATDDITVTTPSNLLSLVGKGTVDFDGGVVEDLQVRYELIDRLGPITRILYAIQKQLLSVAIRGDLARPVVVIRNFFTSVSDKNDRYRALPMPTLTPLPPRF
jgi:hypothetical protein